MLRKLFVLGVLLAVPASISFADISYTSAGATYSENFNTLQSTGSGNQAWVNDSTVAGWFSNHANFRVSNGSDPQGSLYSFGATSATERAIGSLAANSTGSILFGIRLTNNTGRTMTQATVTFDGEQWRNGGNTTPHSLTFDYRTGAGINIDSAGYTSVSQLNFTGPIATNTTGALDGNANANRIANIAFTIKNFTWLPGEQILLRWTDLNDTGNDHGLAIDNFRFVAVPEPGLAGAVFAMGAVFLGLSRRRRLTSV